MVNALEQGDCDGFGLGRPASAEPDIARKFIEQGIQSTAINWAEYDFMVGAGKGSVELYQLGRKTLLEGADDPCHSLMDLSAK